MNLGQILDNAIADCRADLGTLQRYDAGAATLTIARQRGHTTQFLDHFRVVTADDGSACGRALRMHRVTIADVQADDSFAAHRDAARSSGFLAVHSATVLDDRHAVLGCLSVHYRAPNPAAADTDRIVPHTRAAAALLASWPEGTPTTDSPPLERGTELTAAERVRAAFTGVIGPERGREQALAREGPVLEITEQLSAAIHEYARERRASGAPAEAVLVELKSLLFIHPRQRTSDRSTLGDRAISLAIRAYFSDRDGRG